MTQKILYIANPRGFCAGVDRAISIVRLALEQFGQPVFVHHEVVHNRLVIAALQKQGAIFVECLDEVPPQSVCIFSAHGVSRAVEKTAQAKSMRILDATCPLVKKVHLEVRRMHEAGFEIIMIGHAGHPEVAGTMGQLTQAIYLIESIADMAQLEVKHPQQLAYVTQTTLAVQETQAIITALKRKFPSIIGPKKSDICYATQNRQHAAIALAKLCDVVVIVGSPNSSNSNRLKEVVEQAGTQAWMVDHTDQLHESWFEQATHIGLTAGASAPESLVQTIGLRIQELTQATIQELAGVEEKVVFALPSALQSTTR